MTVFQRKVATVLAGTFCMLGSALAQAQDTNGTNISATVSEGKRQFRADYFEAYAPVTALDMIRRIPGFTIADGEGRRGFGENAGNVLIDGDRPSSKSDDIFTILSRIPASEVDYIELTEQAGADAETQGQGQIVNVVRKVSSKLTGTYEGNLVFGHRYGFRPSVNGSATLRRGETTYEFNITSYSERVFGFGPEDFKSGTGNLIERRFYRGTGGYDGAGIGGAIKTRIGGAKVNLNGRVRLDDSFDHRNGVYSDTSGLFSGEELLLRNGPKSDINYEFGGDIEFKISPKLTTKAIGLYRAATESNDSSIEAARVGQPVNRFETRSRNKPIEIVGRIQNDWSALSGHAIQFGGEIAYNQLDARFSAASSVAGAVTVFPASNVLVEETRIEPFLTDVWTVTPKWKIEAGAIFEFSKLTLSGDSSASRRFQFLKPKVIATWTVDPSTTVEFRADRQVAQLDFGEFATSVDVALGNQVDAGNADLVPEKVITLAAQIRHKFLERGSVQFRGEYQTVSDTQDLVPVTLRDAAGNITAQFDGAGNIGNSKRWNGELEITLPLDWLTKNIGFGGMEVKYTGHYHDSRVTDPVTGLKRRMSNRPLWHQEWSLRHDIAKSGFVYGVTAYVQAQNNAYFFNEYRRQKEGVRTNVFVEYSKFKFGTLRVQYTSIPDFGRDRFIYTGTRATGPITQIVNRRRYLDPLFQVTLSGKF
ncbi:TonB-dependent receptor plug domain-containing protein [Sphingorhabdus contaminans]|uniref:TonB-dependent receptor n=1 Tax=Sphingorhabdus contaminans TaxID=1343899 RepID=A0A553WKA2_9SPHN|nr:TonB-dependent receptor [Sphingorhabdus contaminans]TSB05083.1 TonB-dependent receptor [Sphingorhabdus contaminans]